jgi:general secretion pathway protein G
VSLRRTFPGRRRDGAGFTLIELLSVVAIIGVVSALAIPRTQDAVERARVAKAIGDLRAIAQDLFGLDSLPSSLASIGRSTLLDPWGRPYVYYPFPGGKGMGPPGGARKDRFLVPINSAFDLYSVGRDGNTAAPLTAKQSHDDVIMANDGGFFGLASRY